MSDIEIAKTLINSLVDQGYFVSVFEGEAFCLKKSQNKEKILENLNSTGIDRLLVRDSSKEVIGEIVLVWGNEDETLIADWQSSRPELEELISSICYRD